MLHHSFILCLSRCFSIGKYCFADTGNSQQNPIKSSSRISELLQQHCYHNRRERGSVHNCRHREKHAAGKASAVATYTLVNIQFQLFLRDALLDPLAEGGVASRADATVPIVDEATTLSVKRGGRRTIPAVFLRAETIHRSLPPASVDRRGSAGINFASLGARQTSARPIPPWDSAAFKDTSGGSRQSNARSVRRVHRAASSGAPRSPSRRHPAQGAPEAVLRGGRLPSPPRGVAFPLQPAGALRPPSLPRPAGNPSLASSPSERRRKQEGSLFSPPHGLPTPWQPAEDLVPSAASVTAPGAGSPVRVAVPSCRPLPRSSLSGRDPWLRRQRGHQATAAQRPQPARSLPRPPRSRPFPTPSNTKPARSASSPPSGSPVPGQPVVSAAREAGLGLPLRQAIGRGSCSCR